MNETEKLANKYELNKVAVGNKLDELEHGVKLANTRSVKNRTGLVKLSKIMKAKNESDKIDKRIKTFEKMVLGAIGSFVLWIIGKDKIVEIITDLIAK